MPLTFPSMARAIAALALALAAASPAARAHDEALAGYAHGSFLLRSETDDFVLIPHGRLQFDSLNFVRGDTPSARLPQSTFAIRRARGEVNGTFLGRVDFQISGEWS